MALRGGRVGVGRSKSSECTSSVGLLPPDFACPILHNVHSSAVVHDTTHMYGTR